MSKLDFTMTKKEFETVIETSNATVIVKRDDKNITEDEIREYDFMSKVSDRGRELGFARIVTKENRKNVRHTCRVKKVKCVDSGWEFILKLL